jgi:hypothetical protein
LDLRQVSASIPPIAGCSLINWAAETINSATLVVTVGLQITVNITWLFGSGGVRKPFKLTFLTTVKRLP